MIQLNVSGDYVTLVVNGSIQEEVSKTADSIEYNKYSDGKVSLTIGRRSFIQVAPTSFEIDGDAVTDAADFVTKLTAVFGSGGGGASIIQSATVTLTDAQIKALPTTGVEIVAAQGVNTIINPLNAVIVFNWAADYTNIDGACQLFIQADSGNSTLDFLRQADGNVVSDFFANGSSTFINIQSNQKVANINGNTTVANSPAFISDFENQGLSIKINNGASGNLTGGNAANTLKVTVYYTVVDL